MQPSLQEAYNFFMGQNTWQGLKLQKQALMKEEETKQQASAE